MKTIFIHILGKILLFNSVLILSTFPQNTFIKTYPGIAAVGHSLIQTADSGFAIFGHTSQNQAVLIKTDKNGDTSWVEHYGNENEYPAYAYIIKQALDGGYFLGYGNFIIKTESNGALIWDYNFPAGDVSTIETTFDSCITISGLLYQKLGDTLNYFYLLKINNGGHALWQKNYSPPGNYWPTVKDIQATYDRGFIILTDLWPSGGYFQLLKTNMDGDSIWTKTIGGFWNVGFSVVETIDNCLFLTAIWTDKPCEYCELFHHTWLLKLDQNGDTIWTIKYLFDSEDVSRVGKQTKDGGYIISGIKYTIEIRIHLFVTKLNEFGDTVWTKTLIDDNYGDSKGYDIVETFDGGYAVAGSVSYANGQSDMLLLKLDKDGNITNVNDNGSNLIPHEFSLEQNYPNPFNPVTTIEYQLPIAAKVSIKLYDMLGSEVATLVNETKDAGFYKHQFDGSSLASGTYFFRIQANDFVQTKKMTLLK